jgi:hypothetical protein
MKSWIVTLSLVALLLLGAAAVLEAETIYRIDGVFSPSFETPERSQSFVGTMVFPDDTVASGVMKIELTGEPDLWREVPFDMTLNLPGNVFQPWDTRMFAGIWNQEPVTMFAVDYDMEAGASLDATLLQDGGGWDAWAVSFPDWTAGSLFQMKQVPAVTEPNALALAVIGGVVLLGVARATTKH